MQKFLSPRRGNCLRAAEGRVTIMQPTTIVLVGGPPGTPRLWVARPDTLQERVKVPRGNGYEHFEFVHEYIETEDGLLPVYRWCDRTFIAE